MPTVTCTNGCKLTKAEIAEPYTRDGEVLCESCDEDWQMDNKSLCPFCHDYFEDEQLSECFALVDVDGHEPGLYRPLEYPYYDAPMIGRSYFYDGAIERIASFLHADHVEAGLRCAYVCKQCMGETGPWWNGYKGRWDGEARSDDVEDCEEVEPKSWQACDARSAVAAPQRRDS